MEPKAQLGEFDIYYSSSSFLGSYEKMADLDIDPFGDHDKMDTHPDETGETIPLTPRGLMGGSSWKPEHEQETSFEIESQSIRLMREDVEKLYKKLSERYQLPEERHFDMFEIRNGELYYKGVGKPLTYKKGRLKSVGEIDKY